ncbi:unnamed protein product [Kuraishia capsulata CBS 1993]|uniref:Sugar phosphate transporter domain-containing protein n=1 Tax=Kuraishia capsulata CBS 1993 TaxID=1382522 RepID=W6MKE5_9ASCO|nr:uncharacterized protein KUCA_T00001109001 [Kuraishia capsulata CBS 1993]CDK25142.1 unnamed protein product [Kuraishia capsulata CBS 1993]
MPVIPEQIKYVLPPISVKVFALCVAWYSVSSLTSQSTKRILTDFNYPVFVGECQFLTNACLCAIATVVFTRKPQLAAHFPKGSVPGARTQLRVSKTVFITTLPMGFFQFFGKMFSLAATSLVPIATVSSIRALSPLLVVAEYRVYYGVHFPLVTYLSLIPLVMGVVFIVISETTHTPLVVGSAKQLKGVVYASVSTFIFATQGIYAKNVVTYQTPVSSTTINGPASLALSQEKDSTIPISTKRTEEKELEAQYNYQQHNRRRSHTHITLPNDPEKADKITVTMYCATFGFLLTLPIFVLYELPTFFEQKLLEDGTPVVLRIPWASLFLNGVSHFSQALLAFNLLGTVPTVTYSIASMMKRIFVIAMSILFAGQRLSFLELLGLMCTLVGLYCYDRWGSHS